MFQPRNDLKYRPGKYLKKKTINEYIIDETAIKAGSELI
jgi:hypothetical protein